MLWSRSHPVHTLFAPFPTLSLLFPHPFHNPCSGAELVALVGTLKTLSPPFLHPLHTRLSPHAHPVNVLSAWLKALIGNLKTVPWLPTMPDPAPG